MREPVDRVRQRGWAALADYDPALQEAAELLQSAQAELAKRCLRCAATPTGSISIPSGCAEVERRIEAILACARKYRVPPEELAGAAGRLAGAPGRSSSAAADPAALAARDAAAHGDYLTRPREAVGRAAARGRRDGGGGQRGDAATGDGRRALRGRA